MNYAVAAAEHAEASYARDQVATALRIALDLLPRDDARRPRLCARLGVALAWSFCFEEALTIAGDAARLIAAAEGDNAAADYLADVIPAMWDGGFLRGAFVLAQQGLQFVGSRRDATWASLKAMDIICQETEDPENPGLPLDTPERREVSRVFEELTFGTESLGSCAASATTVSDTVFMHRTSRGIPHHSATFFNLASRDDPRARTWLVHLGEYRRALPLIREQALRSEREGRIAEAVSDWAYVSRLHTGLGELEHATTARGKGAALAARLPGPSIHTGTLVAAEDEYRMALDDGWDTPIPRVGPGGGERAAVTWYPASVNAAIARTHARMGRTDRALRRIDDMVLWIERAPAWAYNYAQIACNAAETLWLTGHTDQADVIERNMREKVVAPDFRFPMMDGRSALARLCALQGRYDEALEWFGKARGVLDEQGARPLHAIVDYDEALMYARRGADGDRERSLPLLEAALTQFRAIGMPGWIRRAEHLLQHGREWTPVARDQGIKGSSGNPIRNRGP